MRQSSGINGSERCTIDDDNVMLEAKEIREVQDEGSSWHHKATKAKLTSSWWSPDSYILLL